MLPCRNKGNESLLHRFPLPLVPYALLMLQATPGLVHVGSDQQAAAVELAWTTLAPGAVQRVDKEAREADRFWLRQAELLRSGKLQPGAAPPPSIAASVASTACTTNTVVRRPSLRRNRICGSPMMTRSDRGCSFCSSCSAQPVRDQTVFRTHRRF